MTMEPQETPNACDEAQAGTPYSGSPYIRFEEGSGVTPAPTPVKGTILLVEDEENDAFFMKWAMNMAGVENPLHLVNDGRAAIEYCEGAGRFANREEFPLACLVLLDLKLPCVMGLDVLKWIRQRSKVATPVVVLSSSAAEADITAAYRLGANEYLVKPSEANKLVDMAQAIKDTWLRHDTAPVRFPDASTSGRSGKLPQRGSCPGSAPMFTPTRRVTDPPDGDRRMIQVLLADDHAIVRAGLRALLDATGDMNVIGEAENGPQAIRETERLRPDVILLDVAMPLLNGVEVARQITREVPTTRVLILSAYSDGQHVQQAVEAGAAGYLMKQTAAENCLRAIREACKGNVFFSPPIARSLSKRRQSRYLPGKPTIGSALTSRQLQVLQLIAEGYSSKEMAGLLRLSEKTVGHHRQALMHKLDIHEIASLTRYAVSSGCIEPNPCSESTFTASDRDASAGLGRP